MVTRCHQGAGGTRLHGYGVWADLACTVLITGLATAAGLRRTGAVLIHGRGVGRAGNPGPAETRLALLVAVALLALLVAGLSRMSKAETERIWLPLRDVAAPGLRVPHPPPRLAHRPGGARAAANHLLSTGW